jgi:hypothetical protein
MLTDSPHNDVQGPVNHVSLLSLMEHIGKLKISVTVEAKHNIESVCTGMTVTRGLVFGQGPNSGTQNSEVLAHHDTLSASTAW